MLKILAFIRRHPVLSYYALTFIISWGWILIVVGPSGFPVKAKEWERLMLFVYPAMFAGPCLAGILLTGLIDGRAGFRELESRLFKWQVGARWWAVALLTAPLVILAVLLALSVISPEFLPLLYTSDDKVFLLWYPIVAGLMTALFEEFGWTGFAAATMLRQRHSVLSTGISVGILFGAWHFLVIFWASGAAPGAGALPQAVFLPVVLFTWLPTYRVLMVWVYDRTGSLLVATLMYASLISFWTSLTPQAALEGMPLVTYYLVLTAALWVVIAVALRRQTPSRSRREVSSAKISNQKGASS